MAKGRKNGCPVNIRNWLVSIYDVSGDDYVRIYGLNSLSSSIDSDTEDGSADSDVWAEPYVTKRSGSITLEGREVVVESSGARDTGQELLSSFANLSGCDADATLKFVDPYGHAWIGDYIVTSRELSTEESGVNISWELEQVGEIEPQPYVAVSSIALKDSKAATITTLAIAVGDAAEIITVDFTPSGASNKRFKVSNNKSSVAAVSNVIESGFSVTPVTAGTANITVTTLNGAKTATLAVTVAAGA